MSDQEILKMAAFQMHSCAGRIQKLARETRLSAAADQLASVATELLEIEARLLLLAGRGTDRDSSEA
ncbi:hypothetical protein KF840_01975 [bacterium]|nr:hypothetical protein [bacterium]